MATQTRVALAALAILGLVGAGRGRMPRGMPNTGDPCKDSCAYGLRACEKGCAHGSTRADAPKCLADCNTRVPTCQETCVRLLPLAEEKLREQASPDAKKR